MLNDDRTLLINLYHPNLILHVQGRHCST